MTGKKDEWATSITYGYYSVQTRNVRTSRRVKARTIGYPMQIVGERLQLLVSEFVEMAHLLAPT